MNNDSQLTGVPHVYLSRYSETQYRIDVAIQLEAGETFEIEENQGRMSEEDADYFVLNISSSSSAPPLEATLLTDFKDNIEKVKDKIGVVAYYSHAPEGEKKAKKKVKVLYSDADEGGSGG